MHFLPSPGQNSSQNNGHNGLSRSAVTTHDKIGKGQSSNPKHSPVSKEAKKSSSKGSSAFSSLDSILKRSNFAKATASSAIHNRANVDPRILEARTKLPIWIAQDAIVESVRQNDTVIVLGETGSGKTTQIPQFLFDAGFASQAPRKMIGITQPRRVAAISLAKRVAVELGVPEPDKLPVQTNGAANGKDSQARLVCYSVRFDDRSSRQTQIKFMTDGWLLRELLSVNGSKTAKGKRRADEREGNSLETAEYQEDEERRKYSLLEQYSCIVVDEAHERSVHTDVVIGLIKRVQKQRKIIRRDWMIRKQNNQLTRDELENEPVELKVIVMSATIDAEAFAKFYSSDNTTPAPILYIKGRQFPLQLFHAEQPCPNWIESCKRLMVQISSMEPGDVLIFMTGAEEIESFASELRELNKGLQAHADGAGKKRPAEFLVTKLYAALGGEAIRKCFAATPPGHRKIVLATNIAETSITISGIKYVIDCGLAKERAFQSSTSDERNPSQAIAGASVETLMVKPVSKAAARQRAGRAGRESGGRCFRLFTESTFENLPDSDTPEILRTDLSSVLLDVYAMGLDPLTFDWLDRPQDEGLRTAALTLRELGALQSEAKVMGSSQSAKLRLTLLGKQMSQLPLLPALSKTLLTARDLGDEDGVLFMQALDMVSILSTERRTILIEPSTFANSSEDASEKASSSNSKRDEADRARERFTHPSGDHATQLQALYAFREMEQSCKSSSATTSSKAGSNSNKESLTKLKDWCSTNYVSLKAVREVNKIRAQLVQACKRNGWIPAGAMDGPIQSGDRSVNGQHGHDGAAHNSSSETESDDGDDDAMMMLMHRGTSGNGGGDDGSADNKQDFAQLRRCLMQGKRINTAMRQDQSNVYRRLHGGDLRIRIHPSSSLMLTKTSDGGGGGASRLPSVIYFEDLTFTSQLFARTVSAAEPSWLAEIVA